MGGVLTLEMLLFTLAAAAGSSYLAFLLASSSWYSG